MNAWSRNAEQLAEFTDSQLVASGDSWGVAIPPDERRQGEVWRGCTGRLNPELLARHYRGAAVEHLLQVYALVVLSYRPRWFPYWLGFFVPGTGGPREALAHCRAIRSYFADHELDALILGYRDAPEHHVWVPLRHESMDDDDLLVRGDDAARVALRDLRLPDDYATLWLPLPGRHHTLPDWSRAWVDGEWVADHEAVAAFLGMRFRAPTAIPGLVARYRDRERRAR